MIKLASRYLVIQETNITGVYYGDVGQEEMENMEPGEMLVLAYNNNYIYSLTTIKNNRGKMCHKIRRDKNEFNEVRNEP
jgi:hypothetical protein